MNEITKNILRSTQLNAKEKFKNLLYYLSRIRGAKKSWTKRHNKVFELNKSYKESCNAGVESKHKNMWSVFRKNVDLETLRICKNISGYADERIIPEDIFVSDIEPSLMTDEAVHLFSHKSFYNRWFSDGIFPKDLLHSIDGEFLDSHLNPISYKEFKEEARRINYPVVMKPNWDSYGGEDVFFVKNFDNLISLCEKSEDFVVQEQISQHNFFKKYNPVGLNTLRVYVYKSVVDNKAHVISMSLRMGKGGSLDNETSGGIHTMIREDGFLNNYAVNKYGKKFSKHPDTGYKFDAKIPDLEKLKEISLKVAKQVHFTRIIGLDLCYDENSNWRVIEVNTKGHTIRFAQYGGQSFFGRFTNEVIEYCKSNHWTLKS